MEDIEPRLFPDDINDNTLGLVVTIPWAMTDYSHGMARTYLGFTSLHMHNDHWSVKLNHRDKYESAD